MAHYEFPMIDVEDYLILDKNSQHARYEYLDGELKMLAGGSPYHAAIIANLALEIGTFLKIAHAGHTIQMYNYNSLKHVTSILMCP